jgi:hypothetical protein
VVQPEVTHAIEKADGAGQRRRALRHKAPLAIRDPPPLIFPYRAGLSFVAALRWRQLSASTRRTKPLKSTEQIIHPEYPRR